MQSNQKSNSKNPLDRLGVRSAVYARYSSDMQSQDSADDQIARIQYRIDQGQVRSQKFFGRSLDLSKEWTVKDEAQSGRLAGREGYEKIITGIRNKSFDVLIVDDLSRLTRSLGNLLGLYETLKWYEVELISICDGISSEDPSAKTFFTVKGMVNDFSNDIHAERVIRGMEMRVLQGFSCGDYPYGYDSNPTKFENAKGRPFPSHYKVTINETEAQVIRRIFHMYSIGLGFTRIAKTLNAEKLPSPGMAYAKPGQHPVWSPRGIQHILQNEKYIGIWRWKKTKNGIHPETKLRAAKDRPTMDWVSHMAGKEMREDLRIIEQETWEVVRKNFEENKRIPYTVRNKDRWKTRTNILPEHPFSGLMECGVCSANFQLVGGKKGGYYGCVGAHKSGSCTNKLSISVKRLEGALVSLLKEKLVTPEIIEFTVKKYNRALETRLSISPERLEQIENELGLLERELQNLIQVIISGNASEVVNFAIKEREQRKVRLMSEGASLRRTSSVKIAKINTDDIKARFEFLAEAIAERPMDCFPVIRTFFPKKVRLIPMGKAASDGQSLYSITGEVSLNGVMAQGFNRAISKNKNGEAVNPLPRSLSVVPIFKSTDSHYQGFSTHENGVTNGDRTRDTRNHNPVLYQLSYGHHDKF